MNNQSKRQRVNSPQKQASSNSNPLKAYFSEEFLASTLFLIEPTPRLRPEDILGSLSAPQRFFSQNQQALPQYFYVPQSYTAPTSIAPEFTYNDSISQFTSVPDNPSLATSTSSAKNQQSHVYTGKKRKRMETEQESKVASGYEADLEDYLMEEDSRNASPTHRFFSPTNSLNSNIEEPSKNSEFVGECNIS